MSLSKAVKTVLSIKEDRVIIDKFVSDRFNEKRKELRYPISMRSYVVLDENTISVEYEWGVGDYDYRESYTIDIRPYIREEKIDKIL